MIGDLCGPAHERLATKPSSCGWKMTVYVSVTRESCTFLCADGLLAEHRGFCFSTGIEFDTVVRILRCDELDKAVAVWVQSPEKVAVCQTRVADITSMGRGFFVRSRSRILRGFWRGKARASARFRCFWGGPDCDVCATSLTQLHPCLA